VDPGFVRWFGAAPRERVAQIVAAADISLNLTVNRDENFGFSTVEAMAAGLPVIGTDWGGLKDTIDDGVTGYRIPTVVTSAGVAVDHFIALQRAMHLVDDAAVRRRMGTAAVTRVYDRYLIEQCTDALLGHVRDLVRNVPGWAAAARPHRWTPLGRRLVQRYSVRVEGAPGLLPMPLPRNQRPADEAIVGEILNAYGTRDTDAEPRAHAVFMLAPALPAGLTSADPVYPVTIDPGSPVEAAVCAELETADHLTYEQLIATVDAGPREVISALRRMLAAGVVVQTLIT
jgi:hypothetical protein